MKIVVLNGEFSQGKSSFLGVSPDTVFTVVTTVLIFVLGYVINNWVELRKEKNRLTELEDYFTKLIELLERPIRKQIDALVDFTNKLKEKKEQHYSLLDITTFQVELLREIDSKDLYAIFIKRKKGETSLKTELFGKLRGQIEHVDVVKKSIKSSLEDLMKKSEGYEHSYKESIKITSEAFDNMVSENRLRGVQLAKDQLLMGLDNIRAQWIAVGQDGIVFQDRYIARKHYLDPVKVLC